MKLLVFILSLPVFLNAQSFDVGIGLGGAMYNGDLTVASSSYLIDHSHPALYLNAAYHVNDLILFRSGLLITNISANDKMATEEWQLKRDLNFRSSIYELSLQAEINLLTLFNKKSSNGSPYLYVGSSAFKFNPKAEYNGQYIDLQPLGTEGQGMPGYNEKYDLVSLAVLFGFGYSYELRNEFTINASFGWRRSDTDYLDDISKNYVSNEELYNSKGQMASVLGNKLGKETGSQRGGQYSNDWFNVALVSINYNFGRQRRIASRSRRLSCPSSF